MRTTSLWMLGAVALLACGGKTEGSDGDGGSPGADGGAGSDAASAADSPVFHKEASTGFDAGPPPVVCDMGPASGSGGQGSCEVQGSENCTDGTTYQFSCSCPSGTCTCTQTSSMSGSGGDGIPFSGCPSCTVGAALTACGFPQ
ncbi:MAG TPA: hypothetical protein VIJ22_01425 [Polyangiaceae bacterium]